MEGFRRHLRRPTPTPSWGQAPALHFSLATLGSRCSGDGGWCRRQFGAGIDPGSESGTCFRTNRPRRLPPAHQGMKSRSCGLVQRISTVDSATAAARSPRALLIPPLANSEPRLESIEACRTGPPRYISFVNRPCRLTRRYAIGLVVGTADLRRPTPATSFRHRPSVYNSARWWKAGIEVD